MPLVKTASGLDFFYDEIGKESDPVILLIMGLATQMTAWREPFCEKLMKQGFRVIRFDNRDVGLSTKMESLGRPNILEIGLAQFGFLKKAPYSLADMAQDAAELLDELRIKKAHVIGASMGGMIAQVFAINYPERALSLTSIMSTNGSRDVPRPTMALSLFMVRRPPANKREAIIEHRAKLLKRIGSIKENAIDYDFLLKFAESNANRSNYVKGFSRQLLATLTAPPRQEQLKKLELPTLVIHGDVDPLVNVQAGIETAKNIPNARLEIIKNMGHDLPPQLHDKLTNLIVDLLVQKTPSTEKAVAV